MEAQTSNELLIRIDERLQQLTRNFEDDRKATDARTLKNDQEMEKFRTDIESLRISRAQFLAIAAALSTGISGLLKVFLK